MTLVNVGKPKNFPQEMLLGFPTFTNVALARKRQRRWSTKSLLGAVPTRWYLQLTSFFYMEIIIKYLCLTLVKINQKTMQSVRLKDLIPDWWGTKEFDII